MCALAMSRLEQCVMNCYQFVAHDVLMALDCEFKIGTAQERPSCGAEFLRLSRTFFVFLRMLTLCPDWSLYCDLSLVKIKRSVIGRAVI
jgi:hypothetical protein